MIQDKFTSIASVFSKLGLLASIKSVVRITALKLHYSSRLTRPVAVSLFQVSAVHTFNPVFTVTERRSGKIAKYSLTVSPSVKAVFLLREELESEL